jgi:hypothetical protein
MENSPSSSRIHAKTLRDATDRQGRISPGRARLQNQEKRGVEPLPSTE